MEDNPYQPPRFDELPGFGADTVLGTRGTGLSESEIRSFVGKNANYYLRKWPRADEEYGRATGFDWAAFLLSGLWLSYRKMYRLTIILFAVIGAESILEEGAVAAGLASESSIAILGRAFSLVFSIVCGAFGNAWYLAHAQRQVARIRALGLGDEAYRAELARRGGTSYLAPIGLICVLLAILFMVGLVAAIVLSPE